MACRVRTSTRTKELYPTYLREVTRYVHRYFVLTFGIMSMSDNRARHLNTFDLEMENLSVKTMLNMMNVPKKTFHGRINDEVIQMFPSLAN